MNKKKLNVVRKKIDKLDNKLLNIIKKRTKLVQEVINRFEGVLINGRYI